MSDWAIATTSYIAGAVSAVAVYALVVSSIMEWQMWSTFGALRRPPLDNPNQK